MIVMKNLKTSQTSSTSLLMKKADTNPIHVATILTSNLKKKHINIVCIKT